MKVTKKFYVVYAQNIRHFFTEPNKKVTSLTPQDDLVPLNRFLCQNSTGKAKEITVTIES